MDQNKNQGHQPDRSGNQGQPIYDKDRPHTPSSDKENREKGSGKENRERGRGSQGERNRGRDTSNRGMGRELDEQEEWQDRGSRQSER